MWVKTGNINEIDLHIDRGSVQVNEDLHHETLPNKVATDQVTIVQTGTTLEVEQRLAGMLVRFTRAASQSARAAE